MKKVLKKLPLIVLALVLVLAIKDKTYAATYGKLTYEVKNDGTIKITDCDENASGALTIPDTINGKKVTGIGYRAFYDCRSLTSITILEGVTSIGQEAFFGCSGLTSLTISNSVTSIGYMAFRECRSLTSITIPNSVTSIGDRAFWYCKSLTSITIPSSVTNIGSCAFGTCSSLISINVSDNNKYYCDVDGVLFNKDKTEIIKFPGKKEGTNYKIPNSVTSIGNGAFDDCRSLTSITIPNSVTSIGNEAFEGCSSLTSITIPNSVTSIGNEAFYGCSGLTSITIPNSVTSIGNGAFEVCSSLTNITIPEGVTSIDESTFSGCSSLTNITIPEGVTSIGRDAFSFCRSLTSITMPDSLMSIGIGAFDNCNSLTSITIPNGVTSIGAAAFHDCSSLTNINVSNNNKNYSSVDGVLFNKDKTEIIKYPVKKKGTSYDIPDSVTSIGYEAFYNCRDLTSIAIPEKVTSIGAHAFEYCISLTNITIPEGVTSIDIYTFYCCDSLTNITIPEGVTSIGNWALSGCSSLTSINVSDNNKNYSSIDGVLFNKDKTEIIMYPYRKESTSYDIPNSVTSIGRYAFEYCNILTNITIPNSVTSIESDAIYDCSNLTRLAIPSSVTSIGNQAFIFCKSLEKVLCLGNASKLGSDAFKGCSSNLKIYAKNGLTGYDANGWENYSDKIVRYDESLKKITFTSRKQTEKIELSNAVFKSIASIKSYEIEDKSIVSVDSSGNVIPLKNGTTNVKAVVQYFDGTKVNLTEKIVVNVKSTGVAIKPSTWSFVDKYQSPTKKMAAKVQPIDTAFQDVTWKSSNTKVATVDSSGNVTAVGNGTCKITATTKDGYNKSVSSDVTVDIKAESINLDKTSLEITNLGVKEKLKADVSPSFSTINRPVKWSSSDTNVAKVDNDGNVTPVGNGTCKITATTADGTNLSASCDITVKVATGISLNVTSYKITNVSQTLALVASLKPDDLENKKVEWRSSNTGIATVDENGNVTPVGSGSCKITATTTDGTNLSASCNLVVDVKVKSISFNSTSYTITDLAQTPSFEPNITPSIASKNVTWRSSNTGIATVNSKGVIKAVSNGTCKVTATTTDGTNLSASMDVIVDIKAKSVALDKTSLNITSNNEKNKLNVAISPIQASQKVNWKSSNEKIARVDGNGNVTAVGNGTCKITATTTDGTNKTASCDVKVDIKAESIGFSLTSYKITDLAQTPSFTAKILPENTANKNVTWKSSDTSIATVSSSGVIKAVSNGTCKITATTKDGTNLSASMDVIVDIKAKSVALDKTSMQITSQNSINKLVATVTPSQASQKVAWSSSNGKIATVDSKGRVKAVSNGKCKIIATTTDGTNRTASCDVTVDVKFVTGISFDFNSYTITNVNQTPVFRPNITPSDAEDKNVRWSSSNTKVATVSSSGVIKAAGNGTCKITATTTDGTNLSASFNITVNIKATKITLDKTKIELTTGKETEKITSSIEPSIANKAVKYTSSNTSIATVSSDGVVTAVGSGTCRIIATTTDGSKVTASCDVTVDIKTTGMKLDKTNYTFNKAETIKINPVITPSKASKKLTWTSSNTKVAIVSSDGKVTPVGKGTCKITATTTDGTNLSASCNITSNVEYQKGDVNRDGKVNTLDVYYAMKGIVNGTLTDEEKVILDVNGDSKANTLDINIIMRYIVGQIDSL